jgi:hypothetical protein
LLLLAVACGLVAAVTATRLLGRATHAVDVVVADQLLPPLSRVPAGAVRLEAVSASALPPQALRSLGVVVGQFTRTGLVPGEVVSQAALASTGDKGTVLDARVSAWQATCGSASHCGSLVAMTLPVGPDQGFSMVRQGDRVDVVASYTLSGGPVAQVVAQGVPVLERLGGQNTQSALPTSGTGWLVLGVTESQALRLQLLEADGHLAILLRPLGSGPADAGSVGGVLSESALAGGAGLPATAGTLPSGTGAGG